MKKLIAICLFTWLISANLTFAQKRETKNMDTFSKIAFKTPGKLYLKQGSPQKVELEGATETLSKVNVEVQGSRLVIEVKDQWRGGRWNSGDEFKVYVTVEKINAISVSGSGDVVGETKLGTDDLDLNVSGSGSLITEVDASGKIAADVSGSGEIKLSGKCKDVESHVSGSGHVEVSFSIAENAYFHVSGSGKIQASGTANMVKTSISGSGKVLAANLETNKCDVHISGSGDVEINVKEALDAQISGSGSVSYKGNPDHVNSSASGSGHIRKM